MCRDSFAPINGIAGIATITGLSDRTLANMKRRITFPLNSSVANLAFSSIQISVTVLVSKPPFSSASWRTSCVSAVLRIFFNQRHALPDSATTKQRGWENVGISPGAEMNSR